MRELLEARISNTLLAVVELLLDNPEFPDGAVGVAGFGFGLGAGLAWDDELDGLFGLFAGFDADGCVGRAFWVETVFPVDDGFIGLGFGFEAGLDWDDDVPGLLFGLFAGRDAVGRVGRSFWPEPVTALLWHDPIGYQTNLQYFELEGWNLGMLQNRDTEHRKFFPW